MLIDFLFPYPIVQNIVVFVLSMAVLGLFFALNGKITKNRCSPTTRRKIVHIGVGTIYLTLIALYSSDPTDFTAQFIGILPPALFVAVFVLIGTGAMDNKLTRTFVEQMTREGDRRELLRGILLYGIISIAIANIFWIDNPLGIVALAILYGGDGFADFVGRRWGAHQYKMPWGNPKSLEGSLAVLGFGFVWSWGFVAYFAWAGWPGFNVVWAIVPIAIVCLIATIAEALSPRDLDNIIVPVVAVVAGISLRFLVWTFPITIWGLILPV